MAIWYLNYLKEKENSMGVYGINYKQKSIKAWQTYRREISSAEVHKNPKGFYVDLFENNQLVESREAYEHSESWAESIAENWVDGIL